MAYKQAKRRDDDIAIVTCGLRVQLVKEGSAHVIKEVSGGFGGMGPTTLRCVSCIFYYSQIIHGSIKKTGAALAGKPWDRNIVSIATETLLQDMPLAASAPGGMAEYRRALPPSFFFKFFLFVSEQLGGMIDSRDKSVLDSKHRPISKAQQAYFDQE